MRKRVSTSCGTARRTSFHDFQETLMRKRVSTSFHEPRRGLTPYSMPKRFTANQLAASEAAGELRPESSFRGLREEWCNFQVRWFGKLMGEVLPAVGMPERAARWKAATRQRGKIEAQRKATAANAVFMPAAAAAPARLLKAPTKAALAESRACCQVLGDAARRCSAVPDVQPGHERARRLEQSGNIRHSSRPLLQ